MTKRDIQIYLSRIAVILDNIKNYDMSAIAIRNNNAYLGITDEILKEKVDVLIPKCRDEVMSIRMNIMRSGNDHEIASMMEEANSIEKKAAAILQSII